MLQDYGIWFTAVAGEACAGNAYGSKEVDQLAAADAAVGEPLECFVQCKTDVNNLDSVQCDLVGDDDGAGTNEVVLATRTLTLAELNTNRVFSIGRVRPGAGNKKVLRFKMTENGTDDSGTGRISAWLSKGADAAPNHAGAVI